MFPLGVVNQQTLGGLLQIEDNFTDTDSTLLSAHTSDSGHEWTYFSGVTPDIQSNAVNSKGTCNFLLEPTIADAIVEVDLIQGGNQQATGFYWRSTSAFTNNFALWPDDTQLRFTHSTGNIEVTESNNNSTMSTVVGFKGQEHRIWVNDVHKFSHTDANWTTQRYHGHRFYTGVNVLGVDNLKIHRCIINPTEIDDCILWLDASDRGSTTNQWDDKSGEANHFTAQDAAHMPDFTSGTYAAFDGGDWLEGGDFDAFTEGEIFALVQNDTDSGNRALWDFSTATGTTNQSHMPYSSLIYDAFGSTARKTVGNPTPTMIAWRVINIWSAASDWSFQFDGATLHSTATNTVGFPATGCIGYGRDSRGSSHTYWQGDVKAVVMFSRKLTTVERAQMELYLANL